MKNVEIKHNKGEVMMIDFWASWCPPCQTPMTNNEKMLVKHDKNGKSSCWKGKVRIIGISLDSKVKECQKHIIYKGWTSIEHYLCIKGPGQ